MEKLRVLRFEVLLLACFLLVGCKITVVINAPQDGATFEEGDVVTFSGTAKDLIEGNLTGNSLIWTSGLDGVIGKGTIFSRNDLSVGTHLILLKAINSLGEMETDVVTITIIQGEEIPEVNLYNNLAWSGGTPLTAKLVCSSNTFQADTGEYSNCQEVSSNICDCKLYLDLENYGTFSGCLDLSEYCSGDATLILSLDESDNIALYIQCVAKCGDPIMDVGYLGDNYDEIIDIDFIAEGEESILELHRD